MSVTKQNHQGDFTALTRACDNFNKQVEFSLRELASSITRLVKTTREDQNSSKIIEKQARQLTARACEDVKRIRDIITEEMIALHPFNACSTPESRVLLLIKEKGFSPPNGVANLDKPEQNLFLEEARVMIESDKLSTLMNAGKLNFEEVFNTFNRFNLVYKYFSGANYPGAWIIELTPLGRKLTEAIQKQRSGPAGPTNIIPRN